MTASGVGFASTGWTGEPTTSRRDSGHLSILADGDRTCGVLTPQEASNRCHDAGLQEDGIYGCRTRAAVRRAQSPSGARTDGIYGPETARRIDHFATQALRTTLNRRRASLCSSERLVARQTVDERVLGWSGTTLSFGPKQHHGLVQNDIAAATGGMVAPWMTWRTSLG